MFHVSERAARDSWNAWTGLYTGLHSASHSLGSVEGYGPMRWLEDSATSVAHAYSTAFGAYMSLWGFGPGTTACATLALEFDEDSEMAGPICLDWAGPSSTTPVASDLVLTGTGTAAIRIPKDHVVVRMTGSTLVVTLVNLKNELYPISPPLVPGTYEGTLTVGNGCACIPICATFTACVDDAEPTGKCCGCNHPCHCRCTCGCC